jgi:hypothetical protein
MHVGTEGLPDDVAQHLGSETVVSKEDVADSGDQDAGCHLVDELANYMFRIFMYRRMSGMERSPTTTPPTTTTATTPAATQPITSIMNSYLG